MQTNQSDFKVFEKECRKYIHLYGLGDWDILFLHEFLENNDAECRYNVRQRWATLVLSTEITKTPQSKSECVKLCARHEVREALLATLRQYGEANHVEPDTIDMEVHTIINRLERAECGQSKKI